MSSSSEMVTLIPLLPFSQVGAAFLKNVYSVFRASPASVGFALPPNSTTSHLPSFPSNSSDPARDYGNASSLSTIPGIGGIYGPSGGVSVRTTMVAANTVTTAVMAAGTVRTTSGATRAKEGRGGVATAVLAVALAVAVAVGGGGAFFFST